MSFEQNKNAQLVLVSTPAIVTGTFDTSANATLAMKANAVPGANVFSWDPQIEVTVRGAGQFGSNKPVGMTTIYKGVKGNFDVEGTDGEKRVLAILNRTAYTSFLNSLDNKLFEFFAICNITEDDGAALRAHFLDTCRIDGTPKGVGGDAKRFSFQGIIGYEFVGKKLKINITNGDAVPVTNCPLPTGDTAVQWTDEEATARYALLVAKYKNSDMTVTRLKKAAAAAAGYYAETSGAITLHADDGLGTSDKLITVYMV